MRREFLVLKQGLGYLTLFFVIAYPVSIEIEFVLTSLDIELTRAERINVLVCEFVGSIPGQVVKTQVQ